MITSGRLSVDDKRLLFVDLSGSSPNELVEHSHQAVWAGSQQHSTPFSSGEGHDKHSCTDWENGLFCLSVVARCLA